MNETHVLTIKQALNYLENQLKGHSKKSGGDGPKAEDSKPKEEIFSRYEGSIFENLAPSQLGGDNIQIKKPNIVKSFFTETFFEEMNKEYHERLKIAWEHLKDLKLIDHNAELVATSDGRSDIDGPSKDHESSKTKRSGNKTDNESKSNEVEQTDFRGEIQIDAMVNLKGSTLFEIAERNGHFLSTLGDVHLKKAYEADKTYEIVIEVAVNFLTQVDKKLSQLIHYIIFFKIMKKFPENMTFMILSGYNGEDFIRFVNAFNNYYQDDSKLTELSQWKKEYHRIVMLKQLIKEGAKVLFLHKPFYLRKCFIKDAQLDFDNFLKENKKLHSDLLETRKKFFEADKIAQSFKNENQNLQKENEEYKARVEMLEKKLQRLLKDSQQGDEPSDLTKGFK